MPEARPTGWLRDPLVPFAVLGAGLFVLYAATRDPGDREREETTGVAASERTTVEADPRTIERLAHRFEARTGRPPHDDELETLVERWIDEELMVREGRALGLDRGDPVIRDQVLGRVREGIVARAGARALPEPDDEALRAYMRSHPDAFRERTRFDFEQVFVSRRKHDDFERAVAGSLAALDAGASPREQPGRYSAGKHFTLSRMAATYGRTFAEHVGAQPPGAWTRVDVDSGAHLVRITKKTAGGELPPLPRVRRKVRRAYDRQARDVLVRAEAERLRPAFSVVREESGAP